MSEASGAVHLNNHHRDTLMSIFQHPASHNIDWKAVVSLLGAVGTVDETSDGKFHVALGGEQHVISRPHGKDVDVQTVVDLRRMLSEAGYVSIVEETSAEGKEV